MSDRELFEDLPEQAAPPPLRGAPRLLTAERRQVALRAVDLDGLVAEDDQVRDVWGFVEGLDLSPLTPRLRRAKASRGIRRSTPRS
jgi:hypothetical protein